MSSQSLMREETHTPRKASQGGRPAQGGQDLPLAALGTQARAASRIVAKADTAQKNRALDAIGNALDCARAPILAANACDLEAMQREGRAASYIDRAALDERRIDSMIDALQNIAALDDPVGQSIGKWQRPNGLVIERVRTPLGVIGVIYESRPNVSVDAGALALKSGNAVILRGGSDTLATNLRICAAMHEGLAKGGLPETTVQMVPDADRGAVGDMLSGLGGTIDVIIPRGGKSLVARVEREARVPVFSHLEGICHIFIDATCPAGMALDVVTNAKLRRPGICGAVETVLIDHSWPAAHIRALCGALAHGGCEIRGDEQICALFEGAVPASEDDWACEYLDKILSIRMTGGLDAALAHIETYGSHHTDAILTENEAHAARFLAEVDSAIVMHNASTQFADGGEFGLGAEIGIATGRMHARGPVGLEQLTCFNYRVRGSGQIRPA